MSTTARKPRGHAILGSGALVETLQGMILPQSAAHVLPASLRMMTHES